MSREAAWYQCVSARKTARGWKPQPRPAIRMSLSGFAAPWLPQSELNNERGFRGFFITLKQLLLILAGLAAVLVGLVLLLAKKNKEAK
jgi:hypothetical protein